MEKTQVTQEVAQSIELPTPESSTNSCTYNEEDSLEDLIQLMLAHNSENNSQNDYLDHEISQVDDNIDDDGKAFKVVKTLIRRRRGKVSAVQFGYFSHRGGVTGRGRVRAVASSSPSRTTISRPKTGPGSRGGKGGYKKKLSSPDVSPHSKKSKN